MPFPNFHAARIKKPNLFEKGSFKVKKITDGVNLIVGKLKGKTKMTGQSYRFKKDVFSVEQAKAWLKENDITPILFEEAGPKKTQAFKSENICLVSKRIIAFQNEILGRIPQRIVDKIKETDKHPYFQAYSLCHEGFAKPTIIGEGAKPIFWTRKAIQSIKNIVTKGIKLFKGHNNDNSTNNRKILGEIVHDCQEEINGKLHHIIFTYHKPDVRDEVKQYDVNSQEGLWNFIESAGNLIAENIQKLTGVALANSKNESPAFEGARRLGFVQAFEYTEPETKTTGDVMSDVKTPSQKQLDFNEWRKIGIENFKVYPWQMFKLDDLKIDREFGKYFEELDRLKTENEELKTKYKTDIEKLNTDLNKTRRTIYLNSANKRMEAVFQEDNLTPKMQAYIKEAYKVNKDKLDDLTDEGLRSYIKDQTQIFQAMENVKEEIDKTSQDDTKDKKGKSTEEGDGNIDDKDFTKAENNEFLDEDFEFEQ
jgi:hypothetical protein